MRREPLFILYTGQGTCPAVYRVLLALVCSVKECYDLSACAAVV